MGFFTPLVGFAEPSSLPEWGSWCALLQAEVHAVLQKFCGGVLEERQNKAKLHVKPVAAVGFIYHIFIFPTILSNAER